MNEWARTGLFLVVGAAFALIAFFVRPAAPERQAFDDSGEPFFESFDPMDAASLEIVTFDEATAQVNAFKVEQRNGVWSIPSHEEYPADAQAQLANAAASIVDLVKGPKVSDRAADHADYGVVDPSGGELSADGMGTRVTMKDASGAVLVDLIVGKPVRDSENQRLVRVPGRDRVYTANIDTQYFTTEFEKWIEADLLKIEPWDLRRIVVNTYTVDEVNQRIVQGDVMRLSSETGHAGWTMEELGEGEALKMPVVDELKKALDDLKIVDVRRKPAGLSRELRADDAMELDPQSVRSLAQRGFYIAGNALVSNEGETTVTTKDGVRYVLRFGEIAQVSAGEDFVSAEPTTQPEADTGAARFLFVMVEFDPNLIEEPAYSTVMEVPEDADETARAALTAARERIIAENDKLREEHEQKIADAKKMVAELNDRFADWYYVISDDVYRKIRLTRADLVEPATAEG